MGERKLCLSQLCVDCIQLNEWTDQRRGLIGGVLFGGTGIGKSQSRLLKSSLIDGTSGGAICPLLISSLLDSIGFRWTLRIWAALVLVIVGVAFLFCNPRIPARSLKGELYYGISWLGLILLRRSTSDASSELERLA